MKRYRSPRKTCDDEMGSCTSLGLRVGTPALRLLKAAVKIPPRYLLKFAALQGERDTKRDKGRDKIALALS